MSKFLGFARFLALIGTFSLLATALVGFAWGAAKVIQVLILAVATLGQDKEIIVALIEIVDAFLVASTLLIFAFGIYELFVGELGLPKWMIIHNLHDLKTRLGSMLVLVMAVKFVEKLVEWKDARETLFFGLAITLVAGTLIAFGIFHEKE